MADEGVAGTAPTDAGAIAPVDGWESRIAELFPDPGLGRLARAVIGVLRVAAPGGAGWVSAGEIAAVLGATRLSDGQSTGVSLVARILERFARRWRGVLECRPARGGAGSAYRLCAVPSRAAGPGVGEGRGPVALPSEPEALERFLVAVVDHPALPLARLARATAVETRVVWQRTLRRGRVVLAPLDAGARTRLEALAGELARGEIDYLVIIQPPAVAGEAAGATACGPPAEIALLPVVVWTPRPLEAASLSGTSAPPHGCAAERRGGVPAGGEEPGGAALGALVAQVLRAYREGAVTGPAGLAGMSEGAGTEPFGRWLERVAARLLDHRHPRHFTVAPPPSGLPREVITDLVEGFMRRRGAGHLPAAIRSLVEQHLGASGLATRSGRVWRLDPDPARCEVARHMLEAAGAGPLDREELYRRVHAGPLGLSRPSFELVLMALVFSRRLIPLSAAGRLPLERVSVQSLGRVVRVAPEEVLETRVARDVARLRFVFPRRVRGAAGPLSAGQLWEEVVALRARNLLELGALRARVRRARQEPLLAHLPLEEADAWLDRLPLCLRDLEVWAEPVRGLQELHAGLARHELLDAIERVPRLLVFLQHRASAHLATAGYLAQPGLAVPSSEAFAPLATRLAQLKERVSRAETCLDSRAARAFTLEFARFHAAYREAYLADHAAARAGGEACVALGPSWLETHATCPCGHRLGDGHPGPLPVRDIGWLVARLEGRIVPVDDVLGAVRSWLGPSLSPGSRVRIAARALPAAAPEDAASEPPDGQEQGADLLVRWASAHGLSAGAVLAAVGSAGHDLLARMALPEVQERLLVLVGASKDPGRIARALARERILPGLARRLAVLVLRALAAGVAVAEPDGEPARDSGASDHSGVASGGLAGASGGDPSVPEAHRALVARYRELALLSVRLSSRLGRDAPAGPEARDAEPPSGTSPGPENREARFRSVMALPLEVSRLEQHAAILGLSVELAATGLADRLEQILAAEARAFAACYRALSARIFEPGAGPLWPHRVLGEVLEPLERALDPPATVLVVVDAMRHDLFAMLEALAGNPLAALGCLERRLVWALEPTVTAVNLRALATGLVPLEAESAPRAAGQESAAGVDPFDLVAGTPDVEVEVIRTIDEHVHGCTLPLARLAEIALPDVAARLTLLVEQAPPGALIVVTADHGFTQAPGWRPHSGARRWTHGGIDPFEVLVPLVVYRKE